MEFYIARDGQQSGPFSEAEVRRKLAAGEVLPTDRGWREGMVEWMPLSTFSTVIASSAQVPAIAGTHAYCPPATTSGLAVASLVMGILSFTAFPILPGILAVIFGHSALSSIRSSDGRLTGDGLAMAGLILGYIWVGFLVLGIIALIFFMCVVGFAAASSR